MDLNNINPQWIWIAAGVVGVLLLLAIGASVSKRRAAGRIRPLTADARDRYRAEWRRIEEMFVDRPATAVMQADELINELLRTRGLTTKHSRVADRYRTGRAVIDRHGRGKASTEELRQALLHYRGIYEDLGGERTDVPQTIHTAAEIAPPSRAEIRQDERPRV